MSQTYPHIRAQLTDGRETLLVTAWVQRSSGGVANFLLRQAPVVSLAEALKVISQLARQQAILPKDVDLDLSLQTLLAAQGKARAATPVRTPAFQETPQALPVSTFSEHDLSLST
jgi:hypothetical protein